MLVSNVIEVKTPPPPMYEEEMEEQRRQEARPKYNKELYAASDSELSAVESLDEDDEPRKRLSSKHRKKLSKDCAKKSQKCDSHYEVRSKNYSGAHRSSASNGEELKLPAIAGKKLQSHYSKHPTSPSKEPIKVHSIRSLASELLVPRQEKKVLRLSRE